MVSLSSGSPETTNAGGDINSATQYQIIIITSGKMPIILYDE
jgi:hypothetical protein